MKEIKTYKGFKIFEAEGSPSDNILRNFCFYTPTTHGCIGSNTILGVKQQITSAINHHKKYEYPGCWEFGSL